MKITIKILLIIVLCFTFNENLVAQDSINSEAPEQIFRKIETGIKELDVNKFSSYFQSETSISFINGTEGSFSSNQLFFVIQDFINTYKPISFRIAKISSGSSYSFATGFYDYSYEGIRGIAKFYISLKLINNNWRISQISIS